MLYIFIKSWGYFRENIIVWLPRERKSYLKTSNTLFHHTSLYRRMEYQTHTFVVSDVLKMGIKMPQGGCK
jgi:hypothetical protein